MSETQPIRVMIVDDHPLVRDGLRLFLRMAPDLELAGEADSGEDAVRLCAQFQPDVVLMDLKMPGMDGVAATRAIRQQQPQVRIVALTSFADEELVQQMLKAGAIGYVLKDVAALDLAGAIRAAHAGRATLSPAAAQALVPAAGQAPPLGFDLTPRERQVLGLLAEGLSNIQIAGRLGIKTSTVNFHVGNLLHKLGAVSRTEAVSLALQHKLLP